MNIHRRALFGVFLVAFVILIGSGPGMSQSGGSDGVQIVNGRDGVGLSQDIPIGNFQVDGKQIGQYVSVKVSKGYFVQFCSQKDGTGTCELFGEGTHNLVSTDFAFVRVGKGPLPVAAAPTVENTVVRPAATSMIPAVTVFEQKSWGGRSQIFGPGMYRSFRGEFGKINDNQAMSIVVGKGFRVRLCADEGLTFRGSGDCEVHEEGKYNLRFANSISFIEVIDLADASISDEKFPVVLYEDPMQSGKLQGFDVGTFLASKGQFRKLSNDQASSILVKDNYKALVCSDEPASGGEGSNCEEFSAGRKNLKNKKSASYLKVWKE